MRQQDVGGMCLTKHILGQQIPYWCFHTNGCMDMKPDPGAHDYQRHQTGVIAARGGVVEIERKGTFLCCTYDGTPVGSSDFLTVDPDVELVPVVSFQSHDGTFKVSIMP
eukprot:TRINITY_DN2064_c0_g1_i2.p1 TRINITY_DN2064_c0_g1~~TRINITY_DN2064_c0_g1_i2.p1  ORF type:complete len:109 (+),score=11.11 TRINITY_DN2064_c0_g1_i2:465-791(+)